MNIVSSLAEKDSTPDITYFTHGYPLVKKGSYSRDDLFAHSVCQTICSRVHEHRAAYTVIPIVVMSKTTERCFKTANNDRNITVCLSYPIAIDYYGSVGAVTCAAPSYLKRKNSLEKLGTASPPPGIGVGEEYRPEVMRLSLARGELLVLLSDGAVSERTERFLRQYGGSSPKELACGIISSQGGAEDDRTAAVLSLRPRRQ